MNRVKFFFGAIALFTFAYCSKSIILEAEKEPKVFINGDVTLTNKFRDFFSGENNGPSITLSKSSKSYNFSASFLSKYAKPEMTLSKDNFFRSTFPLSSELNNNATIFSSSDPELKGLFGSIAYFDVNIPNVGKWTESIYVPQMIQDVKLNIPDGQSVSKSAGFDISWSPDNHPLNDKGILIELQYYPSLQFSGPVSNETITQYILVPDNGYYKINSSDLSQLPTKSNININIYRGNYKSVPMLGKENIALLVFDHYFNAFTTSD